MGKKHKSDLEALKESIERAEIEEKRLAKDRDRHNKLNEKRHKLMKLKHKNIDTEKLATTSKVKRDEKGRVLPGYSLSPEHKFKPGVVTNPTGRPKKTVFDDAIVEFLGRIITDTTKKKKHGRPRKNTAASILVRALFQQALAGKRGAMQLLAERAGGKPKQEIDARISNATEYTPEQRLARIKELTLKLNK